jgi:hypothetical protein
MAWNSTPWLLIAFAIPPPGYSTSSNSIFDNQKAYTSLQFWALNYKLIKNKRIFGDMAAVRIGIHHSFKIGNTQAIGLQCLLRTPQVMADYRKLQFKNHPSMSSEHIKFIATNMGLESIQRLDAKVEAVEVSLKAMTKSVQEAVNSAKTTPANKLNNFMATIIKLEK